jgi:hypothetical protein
MGDIIDLDPAVLKTMNLEEFHALMRKCGLTTAGIDSVGKAAKMIVERGAIEVV